eukprot:TRINITY_DN19817_c0_g1_i1.p1 TRINITY_DN19817_c0_g1~~TRINITY_DN19817_c0_g1_i1.p1  ORF type:complete len:419 (+),score=89.14 TRINITY_DN19817_c0_g1_i1:35-1258(+)
MAPSPAPEQLDAGCSVQEASPAADAVVAGLARRAGAEVDDDARTATTASSDAGAADTVFGELIVKAISSALVLVAKGLQTRVITDAVASSCRTSASIVESGTLTNALAASLRLAADSVENQHFVDSVAGSLAKTADTLDQNAIHYCVDRGYRIGVTALQRALSLTSDALENEKVMKTMGYVKQVSESETLQKLTKTGVSVADATMRSQIVRGTVTRGQTLAKLASESETMQRSVQNVGSLVAKVASNETVQSAAGSATDLAFRAISSKRIQALSGPVQAVGTKSVEIVTSDRVQNAASRLWNLVLDAEQRLQGSLATSPSSELEALAEAVSRRSEVQVTAQTLHKSLQELSSVREALVAEALDRRTSAALERERYEEREAAFVEELERMRSRQSLIVDRLATLEVVQ